MKKLELFINCAWDKIKKYFFKEQNCDINHACEKLKDLADEATSVEELKLTEEYAINYNTTTRWQTI